MAYPLQNNIDVQKLIAYLEAKWTKHRKCPMCLVTQWNVHDHAYQLDEWNQGMLVPGMGGGGRTMPVVPVICGNCGYTVLVNAIQAGVMKT